ncbi:SMP-30/gluconolactonase/LRE family protein [Streptomyces tritici]|uniref:SMP-30/gluconolactonase/LRE family protein n=1 Tax=Streptomyces tritici TaxID=2054410 RepID=UPI003AEFEF51
MPRLPRLAATASAALALAVLGAGPATAHEPTVSNPRIVAHFDLGAGQTPESIALAPDGSAVLSFAFARQVAHVTPQGVITRLVDLPAVTSPATPIIGVAAATGLARAKDGTVYVNYATGTEEENGVWRIPADGGAPVRLAALPPNGFPNGLALDEKCGVLYAADSVLGTVWRVPLDGSTPTAWATGTALERLPAPDGFVGANGIKVHKGAVWVSNTDRKTLLRIPVGDDGTAGPTEVRATGLNWIDDFAFTGHGDHVVAALIGEDQLALVRPDGTHKIVLTERDGLDNPTSAAVRKGTLYVASAAFLSQGDPNLLLADIDKKHK